MAVLRHYGGQTPTLRISALLPISGADTSLCPAQAAISSRCCHLTLAVPHLCLYHTSCPHVVQLCNTDHTHTNYKPQVWQLGGTCSGELCFITYIICSQNFCSRATCASTNASFPEQETMHFQIILQSSNEDKI